MIKLKKNEYNYISCEKAKEIWNEYITIPENTNGSVVICITNDYLQASYLEDGENPSNIDTWEIEESIEDYKDIFHIVEKSF